MAFESLFQKYRRLVIFDTETTGLSCKHDQIIEFAAVVIEKKGIIKEFDELIQLAPGTRIPDNIVELTGITNEAVAEKGISKTHLRAHLHDMLAPYPTLLIAYNAHFDLSFLFYMLLRDGDPTILRGKDKLDLLTVYKDRRSYPHRLCNAIEAYDLSGKVVNSHRAVDDVLATVEVMKAMETEKADLERYVNYPTFRNCLLFWNMGWYRSVAPGLPGGHSPSACKAPLWSLLWTAVC